MTRILPEMRERSTAPPRSSLTVVSIWVRPPYTCALAAEGKFSALFLSGLPVVIFFLLQVVAPDFYASIMNQYLTKLGLSIASVWMILGNIVMYKMCNFRI